MNFIAPHVRHMLLCDDVLISGRRVSIINLVHKIGPSAGTFYPFLLNELCVYLSLSGGRGRGEGRIVGVQADSGNVIFASLAYPLEFPENPLDVVGLVIRLKQVPFPAPGLYWVEFRINGIIQGKEPLVLQ